MATDRISYTNTVETNIKYKCHSREYISWPTTYSAASRGKLCSMRFSFTYCMSKCTFGHYYKFTAWLLTVTSISFNKGLIFDTFHSYIILHTGVKKKGVWKIRKKKNNTGCAYVPCVCEAVVIVNYETVNILRSQSSKRVECKIKPWPYGNHSEIF